MYYQTSATINRGTTLDVPAGEECGATEQTEKLQMSNEWQRRGYEQEESCCHCVVGIGVGRGCNKASGADIYRASWSVYVLWNPQVLPTHAHRRWVLLDRPATDEFAWSRIPLEVSAVPIRLTF